MKDEKEYETIRFADAKFSFNGIEIPAVNFSFDLPRREAMPGHFVGQFTAVTSIEISSEFLRLLGDLRPKFRVVAGVVLVAGPQEVEVCPAGFALPFKGLLWSEIGTSRGPEGTNRLRKFVRRGARIVEVRTRGRTGFRSLRAAIEACGYEGCSTGLMTIEG